MKNEQGTGLLVKNKQGEKQESLNSTVVPAIAGRRSIAGRSRYTFLNPQCFKLPSSIVKFGFMSSSSSLL